MSAQSSVKFLITSLCHLIIIAILSWASISIDSFDLSFDSLVVMALIKCSVEEKIDGFVLTEIGICLLASITCGWAPESGNFLCPVCVLRILDLTGYATTTRRKRFSVAKMKIPLRS